MDRKSFLAEIARLGTEYSPELVEQSNALLSPMVPRPDESRVTRDIAYGEHARHRLNLFRPAASDPATCLVFAHDGGFVMGDKGEPGAPFYNNVGAWAQRNGIACATINYRLAPEAVWPAGREDLIRATCFLSDNAIEFGIDPDRIVLMGHSAGATHTADVVALPGAAAGRFAGAVMSSGFYDLSIAAPDPFKPQYLGEDLSTWPAKSSLPGLVRSRVPCLFLVGGRDMRECQRQAGALVAQWMEENASLPDLHVLAGHNHLTSFRQLGTPIDGLGQILVDYLSAL